MNHIDQDRELSGDSKKWANWESALFLSSCQLCIEKHGTVVPVQMVEAKIQVSTHANCYCVYVPMRTKMAGSATDMGPAGADAFLAYTGALPEYYISKENAEDIGWESKKANLDRVLPGYMIGGDVYKNKNKKLPDAPGRIWYEADINYNGGFRNRQRVLYSNDGLIFATYDHYHTFYEITK
jgi:hypothetical protein